MIIIKSLSITNDQGVVLAYNSITEFCCVRFTFCLVYLLIFIMFSFWNVSEHWVYFQALMSEDTTTNRFGLRIVGYLLREHNADFNAKYLQVGECKPRKLKTGKLTIQLRSGLFEADISVGEYPGILRKTVHFDGNDFDVDFACMFKCKVAPKLFGKVEIKSAGCNDDNEISFNLMKTSSCSIYQISQGQAMITELIGLLCMEEKMWQELGLCLNYTRDDIDQKFSSHPHPVEEMLAHYLSNGGSVDKFWNAMIKVAKVFKIHPLQESNQQKHAMKSTADIPEVYDEKSCHDMDRKRKFDVISSEPLTESRLDDIAGSISRSWKSVGRKLSLSELELREIELDYSNGGEREKAFQMLITWRERDPENCVSEKLFSILTESGLKHTALKLSL